MQYITTLQKPFIFKNCLQKVINNKMVFQALGVSETGNVNCFPDKGDVPQWFCKGRTLFLSKKDDPIETPKFRPITCLNAQYKLFNMRLTDVVLNDIICGIQKVGYLVS